MLLSNLNASQNSGPDHTIEQARRFQNQESTGLFNCILGPKRVLSRALLYVGNSLQSDQSVNLVMKIVRDKFTVWWWTGLTVDVIVQWAVLERKWKRIGDEVCGCLLILAQL